MPGKSTPANAPASQNTTPKPASAKTARQPTRGKTDAPPRFPIDWEAGHGAITGPLAMASNAAATAALGTAFDLPTLWPAAVAAAGVLSHGLIAPLRRGAVWSTIAARVTGWAFAGTWCSAAIASDPRHWTGSGWGWAAGTLAAGTMLVGGMAVEADLREEAADEDARAEVRRQINGARWAIAKEWIARIKAVTGVQVQAVGLTQRPDGTGFALEIALPEGSPASKLAGHNVALAEAARLPAGCLVQIVPTAVQGHVLIDVDTVSTADQVHTYGDDFSRRSVLDGLPWFVNRNGKPINVFVRESCALILGPMGAGKTTLFDAILAGFCRCDDVLTWVIDLGKEGDAARPFLAPWLESTGVLPPPPNQDRLPAGIKPGVDWVASTPEQALAMLKAAETVAKWRLGAYAELMRRADTKLLPVSPRIPFIEIVVDEGVEMLSYAGKDPIKKQLGPQLIRLMETTRGMGIRLVLTAVDGNNTALTDSRIRKYSNIRIALTATDAECAGPAKLFGSLRGLDITQLTAPGSGVAGAKIPVGGFDPQPIRTVRTAPSFARTAVAATNSWRAVLEPQAAHLIGAAYARRWEREQCGWLFGDPTP
ncbi:AAA family ATPase, partial [Catenulispora sp. NF23]|uniref:ATP-binding protein n=1 Tax=Catenulispora pinistramenti TaxID=2705254 RepID=UPI001BACB660